MSALCHPVDRQGDGHEWVHRLGLLPTERNRAMAFRSLQSEITRLAKEARQQPILIIDGAYRLRNEVFEDQRLLTNHAMGAERRPCLVLVGFAELRRRLALAVHESLEQRIVVSY